MKGLRPRRPRVKLSPGSYVRLRRQVLERDGWRCQHCGSPRDPQVHHIHRRGRLGDDEEENLITLCAICHRSVHQKSMGSHW